MSYEKVLSELEKCISHLQEAQQALPLTDRMKPPEAYILGTFKINMTGLLETQKIVLHAIEVKKNRIKSTLEPPPLEPTSQE